MKKRILIVCGLISGVICFTVAAMVINIKTIAVLDYTKQINKIGKLHKINLIKTRKTNKRKENIRKRLNKTLKITITIRRRTT